MTAEEAWRAVRDLLATVTYPARVWVLAPRNYGLEQLAEELGTERPHVCVELRYYKPMSQSDKKVSTGIMRNRLRGEITVRFQTPHADDPTPLFHEEHVFRFLDYIAPFTVRIQRLQKT